MLFFHMSIKTAGREGLQTKPGLCVTHGQYVHMYALTGAQVQIKAASLGFFIFCACLDSCFCAPAAQGPVTQPQAEVKELQTPVSHLNLIVDGCMMKEKKKSQ